jgi:hypothetical protein
MLRLLVDKEFDNKNMVFFLFGVFDRKVLGAEIRVFDKCKEFKFGKFLIFALEAF